MAMTRLEATLGAAAASLLAAALITAPRHDPAGRNPLAAHPAAVLAWAKARCFAGIELASDAPRTHTEAIIEAAAQFDLAATRQPIEALCTQALAVAANSADAGTLPTRTGERPLYVQSRPAISMNTGLKGRSAPPRP